MLDNNTKELEKKARKTNKTESSANKRMTEKRTEKNGTKNKGQGRCLFSKLFSKIREKKEAKARDKKEVEDTSLPSETMGESQPEEYETKKEDKASKEVEDVKVGEKNEDATVTSEMMDNSQEESKSVVKLNKKAKQVKEQPSLQIQMKELFELLGLYLERQEILMPYFLVLDKKIKRKLANREILLDFIIAINRQLVSRDSTLKTNVSLRMEQAEALRETRIFAKKNRISMTKYASFKDSIKSILNEAEKLIEELNESNKTLCDEHEKLKADFNCAEENISELEEKNENLQKLIAVTADCNDDESKRVKLLNEVITFRYSIRTVVAIDEICKTIDNCRTYDTLKVQVDRIITKLEQYKEDTEDK